MPKPHFVFTKFQNSFRVHIPNLEKLSIPDIQAIEAFVTKRKGYFDFTSYSFVLQKRLEYEEFQKLVEQSGLDVSLENKSLELEIKPRVGFGQYKGVYYDELPDSYLLWLKNNYMGREKAFIEEEIKNRNL
ncbi:MULTISPECIES: DUF3820 family protein [Sulfurimonas]|uniref:putative quorum-sensing-regulated virulence factor n=1 Tax=Sulfurimonas TaxID=202746 RepID=UPI0012656AA7|nr:DUF3820 family protein [Sulfurimonas indica]